MSLFSGVGGFDLGMERAGFTVTTQAEADPKAVSVLRHHWPDAQLFTDVRDVGAHNVINPPTVIVGGFPCQDISVAGNRAGLNGSRSRLWWEFHRIIGEFLPEWVIIENVPPLLSSNGGNDARTLIGALGDLGYFVEWRVLDSQFFGVPQRRRRVFVVGHLGGPGRRPVLVESEGVRWDPSEVPAAPHEDPTTAGACSSQAVHENQLAELRLTSVAPTLTTGGGKPGQGYPAALAFHRTHTPISGELSPCLSTTSEGMGVLDGDDVLRRITPRECERLQGFPDDWTAYGVDGPIAATHRYRLMGNAVTVPVIEWIGHRMAAASVR